MRIRVALDRLCREEGGIAIPLTMIVISIGFAFVTVAMVSSVNAQRGTVRDQDSKTALAAADAAVGTALLRSNRYLLGLAQCVYPSSAAAGAPLVTGNSTNGWCPAVSGSVGSATWTYQQSAALSPTGLAQPTTIVATGNSDGVTRRISLTVRPESATTILGDDQIAAADFLDLSGNPDIYTNVGTNGDVIMGGNSSVCGHIRHGIGDEVIGTNHCSGYQVYEGDKTLPPLSEAARQQLIVSNRNCQLARTCSPAATYTKSSSFWNATTRTISIGQNADLTLPTGDYFVCQLTGVSNSRLIMPVGAQVRIFFDTPEACGLTAGSNQIDMAGGASIESTPYNPQTGTGTVPGFYLFGSPTIQTSVQLGGGSSSNEMVLYAPYTDVEMHGHSSFVGAMGAKSVTFHGNSTVTSIANLDLTSIPTQLTWRRDRYLECTAGSDPALGC